MPEGDPLAPFRDGQEEAQHLVLIVKRATQDEQASDLPTKSKSRRAMRRWERILSHLENYFGWEMHEYKNQARFHSPEGLLPDQMKTVFRVGKKVGDREISVRSLGKATIELLEEKLQAGLFDDEKKPKARPTEMLALVADYRQEIFGAGMADTVTLYMAHVVGLNLESKILECSEIIELAKWDTNEGPGEVADLPPSRPIAPSIVAKERPSEQGS
jgi:hypothetical protein